MVHEFRDVHDVFEFSCFLQVVCQEADALYVDFISMATARLYLCSYSSKLAS